MMALPDERSEKVENAKKQGLEIEPSEIIGMSREEILGTYYLSDQISKIKHLASAIRDLKFCRHESEKILSMLRPER